MKYQAPFERAVLALEDAYLNTSDRFDARNDFRAALRAAFHSLAHDEEVVERVARAIWSQDRKVAPSDWTWEDWLPEARAALSALNPPEDR